MIYHNNEEQMPVPHYLYSGIYTQANLKYL